MIALGTINAVQAVVRAANATRKHDKDQLIAAVREALGLPPASDAAAPTDEVLTVTEAAHRLAKTPRSVQRYASDGLLRGIRMGRSGKLTGIPASEIDAFIARQSVREQATA